MTAREHVLWGLVGGLAYAVLRLGLALLGGPPLDPLRLVAVTVVVTVLAGSLTRVLAPRLGR